VTNRKASENKNDDTELEMIDQMFDTQRIVETQRTIQSAQTVRSKIHEISEDLFTYR
jgi:hypothetical protein